MKQIFKYTTFIIIFLLVSCAQTDKAMQPAALVKFTPVLNVQEAWSHHIDSGTYGAYLKLTPKIVGNAIFTASYDGKITATNINSGKQYWQISSRAPYTAGIGANNAMLYLGTGDGQMLAIKQINAHLVWRVLMSSEVLAAPEASKNIVAVIAEDGRLAVFNAKTGKWLWSYSEPNPSLILRGSSTPKIVGNTLIAGFADGQVIAFNLYNGKIKWQTLIAEPKGDTIIQRMVDIDVNPVIKDGVVYVASYQGKIKALSLANGKVIWQHDISSYSGLVVGRNLLYITDAKGSVWAFAKNSGRVVWRQVALRNRGLTGPVIFGNTIVVGDAQGYLHFLAASDGRFVARLKVDRSGLIAAPISYQNAIYVYTKKGRLAKYIAR